MDESDLRLINLLVHDPRATYRDLADALGVSVQAVHRRIQQLMEEKVILGFSATISAAYLEAVPVTIFGTSCNRSREDTIKSLTGNELVSGILFGSGGATYVYCMLHRSGELEGLFATVKKAAGLKDAWIGLDNVTRTGKALTTVREQPLSSLDRRIISSLARNCRRSAAEVALEQGVTAATVNRRLARMEEMGAIEYVLGLHPGFSGDVASVIRIEMAEGADRSLLIASMRRSFGPTIDYYRTFSNIPSIFTCVAWTRTLKDLEVMMDKVLSEKDVLRAVPDIIFTGWYFPTWKDIMAADHSRD